MTFDLKRAMDNGGRCQTRDGRPARIICADRKSVYDLSVVALIGEMESPAVYKSDGRAVVGLGMYGENRSDLVNIPIPGKPEGWVNVYPGPTGYMHPSRERADQLAGPTRVTCIRIEWEEPAC